MLDYTQKIALITGAASGKGRELALTLAGRGATVAAVDINPFGLDETVRRIRDQGGNAKDYIADTAKRLPIVGLVDEVLDDWERIDILGIAAVIRPNDSVLTMDEWEFHRTLDVNLSGPFFLMQRVGLFMKAHGGGLIVVAGGEPPGGGDLDGGPAYQISQAGLGALVEAARGELGAYNISVITLAEFS